MAKSQYPLRSRLTALALARTGTCLPLGTHGTAPGTTAHPGRYISAPPLSCTLRPGSPFPGEDTQTRGDHAQQLSDSLLPLQGDSWSQALPLCKEAEQRLPLAQVTWAQYRCVTCGVTLPICPMPKRPLQAPLGRCTALWRLWRTLLACFLQGCATFPFPLRI